MDTTDQPMDPAEMCEMVGRLIFRGLPVPACIQLSAGYGRPTVQVMADALADWIVAVDVVSGEWTPAGRNDHYRGHADGFDLIAVRDHVCEPAR